MKKESGFILPLIPYAWIGAAAVIAVLLLACWGLYNSRESIKNEFTSYRGEVERLGKIAKEKADAENLKNKLQLEASNAEREKLLTRNAALAGRLRNSVAGSSFLPGSGSPSEKPDSTICLNRQDADRAIRSFASGTAELIIECQQNTDDLLNAREWAVKLPGAASVLGK